MNNKEEIIFELPEGFEVFNGTIRNLYEAIERDTAQALAVPSYLLKSINERVSWSIL